jgi:hypothetical protein
MELETGCRMALLATHRSWLSFALHKSLPARSSVWRGRIAAGVMSGLASAAAAAKAVSIRGPERMVGSTRGSVVERGDLVIKEAERMLRNDDHKEE